jgi:60 kDa SS-A/Ro ribonucleoprotein
MNDALSNIRTRNTATSQTEKVFGRDDQVKNNAGGYVFEVAGEARIKRFLTLGTEGGTYYQGEAEYTAENAAVVIDWAKNRSDLLVPVIREISVAGRAPRQNPALFALAAVFAFGDEAGKLQAKIAFNDIVRTGTHLFTFVKYTEQLRGWGRSVKNAVASWYTSKDARDLSYQMIKYRQRENWTHRDVLRTVHPKTDDVEKRALFDWACGRSGGVYRAGDGIAVLPEWARPFDLAQNLGKIPNARKSVYADVIREFPGLPWEALPDVALTYPETWEALISQGMPVTALIRQLPRLTNLGLLQGSCGGKVIMQLTDEDKLRKGRVHPVRLLYALKTYAQGHSTGDRGSTWTPNTRVTDALDQAFYTSFGTVEPAGKRTLIAMDVSGSMGSWGGIGFGDTKQSVVTPAEGAMAMSMVTMATEPSFEVMGFASTFRHLDISPRRRLDDNLRTVRGMTFGRTDCGLPMTWARENAQDFDTFIVYTDNETYAGPVHPFEAMRRYRQATGINAKLIVVGMTSTGFSIAEPSDPGMLDVAGFDSSTPNVISGFSRGDFS